MIKGRTLFLLALAMLVGCATTVAEQLIFALALGRSVEFEDFDVMATNSVLTALPFLFLSFKPKLMPAIVALVATAAVHGWWLAMGIGYQRSHSGGGAPIFGAIIMLFAPLIILALTAILTFATSAPTKSR